MADRKKLFFRVRVGILAFALVGVILYAVHDVRSRRARNEWDHTLAIAIVIVRLGPVEESAIPTLRARTPALEQRMTAEMARYRPGARPPFAIRVIGPVDGSAPPPSPTGEGALDLASHALDMWRWTRDVDAKVAEPLGSYDSRVYVAVRPPASDQRNFVEGVSEQGGRIGAVSVELDHDMADLALIVAAHELLHTLSATDKYDDQGRTKLPDGLEEPARLPLYPQRFADLMARNRPVSPTEEKIPQTLDEIAVGPATAREIGW